MAKKNLLISLIVIGCIPRIGIAQTPIDSVYMSVFEPNRESISLLNKVLNTKHIHINNKEGTFLMSGKVTADSLVVVNVLYDSTWGGCVLNDFRLQQYYGCLIYKDRLFMLDNSLQQVDSVIFNSTQHKKGFVDYGSTMLEVINDREVIWSFVLIDGKFENAMIYPPGVIFDFDSESDSSDIMEE